MFKLKMAAVTAKALRKSEDRNTPCQIRTVLQEGYLNGLLLPFHTEMLSMLCTYSYGSQLTPDLNDR